MNRDRSYMPVDPVAPAMATIRVVLWLSGPGDPLVVWLRLPDPWRRNGPEFGAAATVAGLRMELAESLPTHDRALGVWLKSAADRSAWLERLLAERIEFVVEEDGR